MKGTGLSRPEGQDGRKRQRRASTPLPAFTDVTASVAAATFTARRLPELKELYQAPLQTSVLSTQGLESGGGKKSSRHLRRRVTSFRRRQQHRFPVQAPPKKPLVDGKTPLASRRSQRRNKVALQETHSVWKKSTKAEDTGTKVLSTTATTPTPTPIHWMSSHVWHAKRFHMRDLWGWQVPLLHSNRGTKAALRLVMQDHKCLVQDVTWRSQPVWLKLLSLSDLQPLQQALLRILPEFSLPAVVKGRADALWGESLLHVHDQNPLSPLGPARFLVRSNALLEEPSPDSPPDTHVYIWVHPSIRPNLWRELSLVLNALSSVQGPYNGVEGGLSCLQLRGENTLGCLRQSLLDASDPVPTVCPDASSGMTVVPFLVLSAKLDCLYTNLRNPSLPCNFGVCGIDVFGSPDRIKVFLLQLILRGGACPIGLIEETALRLECELPMPVFPRDFPDTVEGIRYWQGSSPHWALMREYDYGCSGRIKASPLSSVGIPWTDLVPLQAETVVVVRGAFLRPFLDALISLNPTHGRFVTDSGKRRRRTANPLQSKRIPTPPLEQRSAHESYCAGLTNSLTLAAVLFCHIVMDGPGTLIVGKPIFRHRGAGDPIGYVTASSFSPALGVCHGTALVGADSLLTAISQAHSDGAAVSVRRTKKESQKSCLLVSVGTGLATLALLH
jgi:hypothetical protein